MKIETVKLQQIWPYNRYERCLMSLTVYICKPHTANWLNNVHTAVVKHRGNVHTAEQLYTQY